jgi:hypothetical protein
MSDGPLKLSNQDFWFDPFRTEDEVLHGLAAEGFLGLVLDGPRVVDVTRMTSLPIQGVRAQKAFDGLALPGFSQSSLVVAVRLDRGRAQVAGVTDRSAARAPNRADLQPGDARTFESYRLNLRARLGLPWEESEYAVWVLQREQLSNRVMTRLVKQAEPVFVDSVVSSFVDQHKKTAYPQPIWPRAAPKAWSPTGTQALPFYRALEGSPEVPQEPGIALDLERVLVVEDGFGGCVLRGSFRLPLLPRERVRPCEESDAEHAAQLALRAEGAQGERPQSAAERRGVDYLKDSEVEWPPAPSPSGAPVAHTSSAAAEAEWRFADQDTVPDPEPQGPWETGHVWQEVGDDDATAVIPVTLVVVGAQLAEPFVLNLQVPAYSPADSEVATGHFTLDLLGFKDSYPMRGQTSWVYAFSGRHAAGPCPVALLRPEAR